MFKAVALRFLRNEEKTLYLLRKWAQKLQVPMKSKKALTNNIGTKWEKLTSSGTAHIDYSGQSFNKKAEANWKELSKTGTAHKNYGWVVE